MLERYSTLQGLLDVRMPGMKKQSQSLTKRGSRSSGELQDVPIHGVSVQSKLDPPLYSQPSSLFLLVLPFSHSPTFLYPPLSVPLSPCLSASHSIMPFSFSAVWQCIQAEVQVVLCDFLQVSRMGLSNITTSSGTSKAVSQKSIDEVSISFSFDVSNDPSVAKYVYFSFSLPFPLPFYLYIYMHLFLVLSPSLSLPLSLSLSLLSLITHTHRSHRMSRGQTRQIGKSQKEAELQSLRKSAWIQPSPYHVVFLYSSVAAFSKRCCELSLSFSVGKKPLPNSPLSPDGQELRLFLDQFIHRSFLPTVESDTNIRVKQILDNASAFSAQDFRVDGMLS